MSVSDHSEGADGPRGRTEGRGVGALASRSGILTLAKLASWGSRQAAIWSRPSARTLKNVCIRQWTLPTSKAAVPALYPGHLWIDTKKFALNADIRVTRNTPPTFLVQAEDDNVDSVNHSLVYYIALKNAGVPVEMHLYAHGGHAVGLRPTKLPITDWPQSVVTWLRTIGMISASSFARANAW